MRIRTTFAAALSASLLTAPAVLAQTPQAAAERLDVFLDRFGGIEPGYAVVVVTAEDVLLNRVEGVRDIRTGTPLTADTPIYIASQTKAYVGLLAAVLDERGILDLDSSIADHWPQVDMPGEVDAADWTLRDLLTHQVPIDVDLITWLEAYAARVDPADYPRLIAEHGTVRDAGFGYDNLGYNIYAAILESATGRSWQDWLDAVVFDPMGLENTSARTSDFAAGTLSWNHIWQGEAEGWHSVPPKTDAMMQSAGGLVTSPGDMAMWLQLQLRGSGSEGSGITAAAVQAAQTSYVDTHQEDGRNAYELPCSGYSLGWNVCDFDDHELLIHGGGYTGARSVMAVAPDLGVGIAVFSNSDNMTGWLSGRTVVMYLQFLTEHPEADRWADLRVDYYPEQVQRLLDHRMAREAEVRAEERWGGWAWQPDAAARAEYAGRYDLGDGYRIVEVREGEGGGLVAWLGDARYALEPASADLFGGVSAPFDTPDAFRFQRDEAGRVVSLDWDGDLYERVE